MKTIIYVDGFNLYYGLLRNTQYKWLDLESLFKQIFPNNNITKIKYFTANIKPRDNQDIESPNRQKLYLKALQKSSNIKIIKGHFKVNKKSMKNANPPPEYVEVIKTEEKGSDVNLSVHLLNDAWENNYDCAIVVSNDSDMCESLKLVKNLGKTVGLIPPITGDRKKRKRVTSANLTDNSDFTKYISEHHLRTSQFPEQIPNTNISKPSVW